MKEKRIRVEQKRKYTEQEHHAKRMTEQECLEMEHHEIERCEKE